MMWRITNGFGCGCGKGRHGCGKQRDGKGCCPVPRLNLRGGLRLVRKRGQQITARGFGQCLIVTGLFFTAIVSGDDRRFSSDSRITLDVK